MAEAFQESERRTERGGGGRILHRVFYWSGFPVREDFFALSLVALLNGVGVMARSGGLIRWGSF